MGLILRLERRTGIGHHKYFQYLKRFFKISRNFSRKYSKILENVI